MVGIPRVPDGGGVYTVGEAGRETVFLPGGASLATAGRTMMLGAQNSSGPGHPLPHHHQRLASGQPG